jgi:hypothetical protein
MLVGYRVQYISESAVVLHVSSSNGTDHGDRHMDREDFDAQYEKCGCDR